MSKFKDGDLIQHTKTEEYAFVYSDGTRSAACLTIEEARIYYNMLKFTEGAFKITKEWKLEKNFRINKKFKTDLEKLLNDSDNN